MLFGVVTTAVAAPTVSGEFAIPGGVGANNEIVQGPDGNMWVTRESVNGIARIAPDGTVTPFPLSQTTLGITVGPDGNLWASEATGVAKIPPANPAGFQEYPIGGGYANGQGIVTGPDNNIWIVGGDKLVRINPANPTVGQKVTTIAGMNAKGMDRGSDGLLWIADGSGRVISATATDPPATVLYNVGGGPQDVAAGPGGQIAYANPLTSPQTVGLLTPSGTPSPIALTNSDPFGAVFGQDGAYWIPRSATNDLLRLTPAGATSMLGGFAPSGGVGPRKIATGPGNTLWVTLDTPDKVARVTGVDPPVTPPPPTPTPTPTPVAPAVNIDKAPKDRVEAKRSRAKVKFAFSSATAGATFECALAKNRAKSKRRAAEFAPCRSPKTYKLKPGRYSFSVHATRAGLTGRAARAKFKVVEAE